MISKAIASQIAENEQRVALEEGLIRPNEKFTHTPDQVAAIKALSEGYAQEAGNHLLVAPTGSGKTEVELYLAVSESLRTRRPVVVMVPTRDLARQQLRYFSNRLKGTPLYTAEIHGGIPPLVRKTLMHSIQANRIQIIIASALVLSDPSWKPLLDRCALLIVDDVNAYDPQEHLKYLQKLGLPMLFATATPEPVERFLESKGANRHVVTMTAKPFEAPPTGVRKIRAHGGEKPIAQLARAKGLIDKHLKTKGRIFVISLTRQEIPFIVRYLKAAYEVPVLMLHGEMADTRVMARNLERHGAKRPMATRIHMMKRFRECLPSILVATNLVGAGLDVPSADLVVVTDADGFGEAEIEQLIGRVGRRNRPSDALLITGTIREKKRATRHR